MAFYQVPQFNIDICDALGLDPVEVYSLVLRVEGNELPTVEVTFRYYDDSLEDIVDMVRHYQLCERPDVPQESGI